MPEILLSTWLNAAMFFLVATAYSSVGIGDGSSYTASMVILGFNLSSISIAILSLNLVLISRSVLHSKRYKK